MFAQRECYFSRLSRSYPILRLVDIYDRQSFIRAHVLDNVYVCALIYAVFYVTLWYTSTVIKRIEKSNREMLSVVEENRKKLDDVVALKGKRAEYEEVVVKAREAQKATSRQLEHEMQLLSSELLTTTSKMTELERIIDKHKRAERSFDSSAGDVASRGLEGAEGLEAATCSHENYKILEPSFPPTVPPEPPPRKYGIFVTRPPGKPRSSPASARNNPTSKIGFK